MAGLEDSIKKIKSDLVKNQLTISEHCLHNFENKKGRNNLSEKIKKAIINYDDCFIERKRIHIIRGIFRLVFSKNGILITCYDDRRLRK